MRAVRPSVGDRPVSEDFKEEGHESPVGRSHPVRLPRDASAAAVVLMGLVVLATLRAPPGGPPPLTHLLFGKRLRAA